MPGLIGMAMLGAAAGSGEGIVEQEKKRFELEKQAIEIMARENIVRLSGQVSQETHAANAANDLANLPQKQKIETDEAIRRERAKPQIVSEGSTLRVPGQEDFTPPKTEAPKPQEILDYYSASAARLNAEAKAIDDGVKYRDRGSKAQKVLLPKYKTEKDSEGNPYIVEEVTGAIGRITPGDPAQPEKRNWFSPNEPAKKAGAPKIEWTMPDGTALPGGPSRLFPGAPGVSSAPEGGGAAPVPGKPPAVGDVDNGYRFNGGNPRDPKSWSPVDAKETPARTDPAQPGVAATVEPEEFGIDKARSDLAAAESALKRFGAAQRNRDPEGFNAAQTAVVEAQRMLRSAHTAYQKSVGEAGGAVRSVRMNP